MFYEIVGVMFLKDVVSVIDELMLMVENYEFETEKLKEKIEHIEQLQKA